MQNENITDFFNRLIDQSGSYDVASREFKRIIAEDAELNEQYVEWCESEGLSPRSGFDTYCIESRSDLDSVWDSLNDYDE